MALTSGARLGPYEIIGAIGSGGMGVVYKARDTRLDRTVAIKVLPEDLAATPESRERFEREAKAISQLNHPHICILHDVGSQNGIDFLVMEYLDGETLAERLSKGALPQGKALELGVQIADALVEAHRVGIVHRDLKPANVMLTKSGVKLLDFGLAKLVKGQAVSGDSDALTRERTLVGTLRYMAPEQLEGKSVDVRADLWAFGVVLYEMLTGESAFEGGSPASLISAILKDEPVPLRELQPLSPRSLERLVQKCLRKDPDDRWQTARDLKDELVWIGEGGDRVDVPNAPARRGWLPIAITAAVGILASLLAFSAFKRDKTEPPTVTRFAIDLPRSPRSLYSGTDGIAISPDGTNVVFPVRLDDGRTQLQLRPIGKLEATPLLGTEGATNPFFSPDGQSVAFYAEGWLKKVSLAEGASSSAICPAGDIYGASWEPDGTIWYADFKPPNSGIFRVSASGGTPEPLNFLAAPAVPAMGDVLPGGKALLFWDFRGNVETSRIGIVSLETLEAKRLHEGGAYPRYVSSGHILFESRDRLMAAPFDVSRLELRGGAASVVQDLRIWQLGSRSRFDVSNDGSLAYFSAAGAAGEELYWVDRSGAPTPVFEVPEGARGPSLSPDGRRIAVQRDTDIWTYDLDRETWSRLTLTEGYQFRPVWSHDGAGLFFTRWSPKGPDIFFQSVDGRGSGRSVFGGVGEFQATGASSDGKRIIIQRLSEGGDLDVVAVPLGEEGEPRVLVGTQFNEHGGVLSPDDRLLAYVSDESGGEEVYVLPVHGEGGRVSVSTNGGTEPRWSRDGRELHYRVGYRIMAVEVSAEPELQLGKVSMLFEGRFATGHAPQYDVATDGRFVMLEEGSQRLHVVLNWLEELKRLVPVP